MILRCVCIFYYNIFFVTLEEIAIYLCIKAVRRIEKNWGYDLETVLFSRMNDEVIMGGMA